MITWQIESLIVLKRKDPIHIFVVGDSDFIRYVADGFHMVILERTQYEIPWRNEDNIRIIHRGNAKGQLSDCYNHIGCIFFELQIPKIIFGRAGKKFCDHFDEPQFCRLLLRYWRMVSMHLVYPMQEVTYRCAKTSHQTTFVITFDCYFLQILKNFR